jgi:hypothetical protein
MRARGNRSGYKYWFAGALLAGALSILLLGTFLAPSAQAAPASTTLYQDSSTSFSYTGTWATLSSASYSGGTIKYSTRKYWWRPGASVTISFKGTGLTWIAKTGPSYGKARVIVDGGTPVVVDLYSAAFQSQRSVWSTGSLSSGSHVVKVSWTGQKNPKSTYTYIDVDAVQVARPSADRLPATVTTSMPATTTTTVSADTTTPAPSPTTTVLPTTTTTTRATTTTSAPAATTTTSAPAATTTTSAPAATTTTTAPAATTTTTTRAVFDLQRAIDASVSGATITIPAGTYTGPFNISGKSHLTVTGPSTAILTSTGDEVLGIYNSSNITLTGFTVAGDYTRSGQRGIGIFGLSGGLMQNLTIRDAGFAGVFSNGQLTQMTVDHVSVTHCGDFGIVFQGGYDGVTIQNVVASDFAGLLYPSHALYLKDGNNFTVQDCDLGRAYGPGGGVAAIQVGYGATNGKVLRTIVRDSPFGICLWGTSTNPSSGITFSGNVGRNNSQADFYQYGAGSIQATWTSDNQGTYRTVY